MEDIVNKRMVSILVVILIILGVGVHFYQQAADQKEQAGKTALYEVQKTYETETTALPQAERAPNAELDVDAKYPKTVSELKKMLAEKKAPNSVLFEAAFKLGTLYLDHGQTAQAVSALKEITQFGKTDFQKASGFYLLGMAQERAKQFQDAIASFQKGLKSDVSGMNGEFLLGMIRSHLKLNEKEKAKLYVEKLNQEFPGSAAARTAEELMR